MEIIMHISLPVALAALASLATTVATLSAADAQPSAPTGVLSFTAKDIDGNSVPLSKYKGDVIMIVNTASLCGNTPQYKPLEALYSQYKGQGFVVLGFPANNFASQEPGTNLEIKQFCTSTYSVNFPMFSKISVKGDDIDPLYEYLTSTTTNPKYGGAIEWNFAKFLIARDGTIVNRFPAKEHPDQPDVVAAIQAELAKK